MRMHEVLSRCIDGLREVVDMTPEPTDLEAELRLPEGVAYRKREADHQELGRGQLLLGLVGADAPFQTGPDALADLLRHLGPGARGVLLLAWPVEDLPYHRLLGPLVEGGCRVVEAWPVNRLSVRGVHAALVVERVDQPGDATVVVRPPLALWVANESVLSEFQDRALREHLAVLDRRLQNQEEALSDRTRRLREAHRKIDKVQSRLTTLETSASFRIGRAVVRGMRHPASAVVTVPRHLVQVWRDKRSATEPPPPVRVVPIALPTPSPEQPPTIITLSASPDLLLPLILETTGLAGYEPASLACFLAAMDVAGPGAVLDIGANIGVYAAVAAAMTRRDVRAFEPVPELAEAARRFGADNDLAITTEALALGAENGDATLYLSDCSDTSNSLVERFRKHSQEIQVPVETLDSYVDRTGAVPAVLKVDTEMTEPDVLAGAARTIARHRPWILCEVLAHRVERQLTEVLAPFDYYWYPITEELPYREADEIVGDETHQRLMWLFAPQRPTDRFWDAVRAHAGALAHCTPERAHTAASA
jgi:FkbM family methyltransferase